MALALRVTDHIRAHLLARAGCDDRDLRPSLEEMRAEIERCEADLRRMKELLIDASNIIDLWCVNVASLSDLRPVDDGQHTPLIGGPT